jgi:hypothetical protein
VYLFCFRCVQFHWIWVMLSSVVSRAAAAAGVPPRYIYWTGHSGRRHLFTAAGSGSIADFEDGVALAVDEGRIAWAGEVAALAVAPCGGRFGHMIFYVHLLARSAEERRAIIEDLRPLDGCHLKLAA